VSVRSRIDQLERRLRAGGGCPHCWNWAPPSPLDNLFSDYSAASDPEVCPRCGRVNEAQPVDIAYLVTHLDDIKLELENQEDRDGAE
jgi:hypothetical protein